MATFFGLYFTFLFAHEAKQSWTKKACKLEAKKYKTRSDFSKGSSGAYDAARKKGLDFSNAYIDVQMREENGNLDDFIFFRQHDE